jgi:hypothetical protein
MRLRALIDYRVALEADSDFSKAVASIERLESKG